MQVVVINQHTANFGDDAAGEALLQLLLSQPNVSHIDLIFNGPDGSSTHPRVAVPEGVRLRDIGALTLLRYFLTPRKSALRPRSEPLGRLTSLLRQSDLVLVAPSGANIGIYRDWAYLVRVMIAVREGATPIFHWNTIGASGSRLFDHFARRTLRKSKLYVREEASAAFLKSVRMDSVVGFDTAFALAPLSDQVRSDVLSFVPSELDSWHPQFKANPINDQLLAEATQSLARFAISENLSIEVLPHLRSNEENEFNLKVCRALKATGLPANRVQFRVDIETYEEYDSALASSRLVVGGRYHSVVLAAKNYRPFVALCYENKMKEACRYLKVEGLDVDLQSRQNLAENITTALKRAYGEEPSISDHLKQVIAAVIAPRLRLPLVDAGVLEGAAETV